MGWTFWKRDGAGSVSGPSFSMPVEDVFSVTGRGTVVTGRIVAGTVTAGQEVTLTDLAGGTRTSVVSGVEKFHTVVDTAGLGDDVGLQLAGVAREDVGPGDVVSA